MIIAAAVIIGFSAVGRLLDSRPLENLGLGLAVSLAAAGNELQ